MKSLVYISDFLMYTLLKEIEDGKEYFMNTNFTLDSFPHNFSFNPHKVDIYIPIFRDKETMAQRD